MKNKLKKMMQDPSQGRDPDHSLQVRLDLTTGISKRLSSSLSLAFVMFIMLPSPQALALEISYSGRLQESTGKSSDGPLDFTVKFYNDPTNGDVVGPTLTMANMELIDGVFQLNLTLNNTQMAALFGDGSKPVYIEIEAGGKLYPRQRFTAVPLALRVPVDTNRLNYTNDGKLTIESVDLNQISGLSAALAAKADANAVSGSSVKMSNNLSDLTSASTARTNLGLGPLATASAVGTTEITDGSITNVDISASAAIADTKLATIATAGKVSGSAITSGTIGGATTFDSSGAVTTSGTITGTGHFVVGGTGSATTELRFNDNDNSNYVTLKAPATVTTNTSFILPAADGTGGQLLKTDGSGNLGWISVGGGGDMLAGNNLSDLTNKPLARTTLGLGSLATLNTVGSTEITDASIMNADINTSAAIATSKLSGAVTGITGHGLGSLATASAVSGGTAGTITDDSITDADINSAAAIAQSKISGLTTSLSGKESTVATGTTAQFYRGDKAWTDFNTTARSAVSNSAPLTYNSGTGVFGLGQASGVADGYLSSSDFTVFNAKQAAISVSTTVDAGTVTTAQQNGIQLKPFNTAAGNTGELRFTELAAAGTNYVGFKAPDTLAGDRIWTLPPSDGTSGQVLRTDGSGILSWISPSAGNMLASNNLSDVASASTARTNLGLGGLATLSNVGSTEITNDSIINADINDSAAIATSKLSGAVTSITGHGLGFLATLSNVGSTEITNDSIMNTDINTSAAIATSKLSGAVTSISSHGLGSLATLSNVGSTEITNDSIVDADINASAAIADTKLATISTAGKVSGSAITSGTIGGSTVIATSGQISSTGNIRVAGTGVTATDLRFGDNDDSNYVGFKAPATITTNRIWTLPAADGTSGQILKTDGSGTLSWISAGGGGDLFAANNLSDLANASTARTNPGLGGLATLSNVGSTEITNDSIVNTDINASAAIATSKLSGAVTSITGHGLGSLATLSNVGSTEITNDSIMNADVNASAAIATSKLSGAVTDIASHGLGSLATLSTVSSTEITNDSIVDADINASAAIADTKLATISTAGKVSGSAITSGTIGGSTVVTTSGQLSSTGNIRVAGTGVTATDLRFGDNDDSHYVGFKAPGTVTTDKIWTLPAADGTSGQVLRTDGSGILSWISPSTGNMLASNNLSDLASASTARTNLGLGGLATLSNVGSTEITNDSIMNADINASAAIATSKLSGAVTSITGHGLGSLATLSNVGSTEITNDSIMNTDINTAAAIATSKLSGAVTSIASHGLGSLATLSTVGSAEITNDSIMNADINASAAIADTKLATISTAGKVSGSAITSGTIGGTTVIANSGQISTTGHMRVAATGGAATDLRFGDNDDSHYVGFKAPATVTTNYIWTLPSVDGTSGQVLSTNGSGALTWASSFRGTGTGGGAASNPSTGCPTGYILVPGDAAFGTTDFCVMKYEAKFGPKGALSQAIGLPARYLPQFSAQASCRNLGPGYALINNAEWMTVATNAANVASNWSGASVGSGALNRGHTDSSPADALTAVTDDNDPCNGTGQSCNSSTWNQQRRTHVLSNSNVIWDLAGNVWEWVDYINRDNKPTPATGAYYEFTAISGSTVMPKTELVPTNAVKAWWSDSWNGSTQSIGQIFPSTNASGGALLRGGSWEDGVGSGLFAVSMYNNPSGTNTVIGFRCVFRPESL